MTSLIVLSVKCLVSWCCELLKWHGARSDTTEYYPRKHTETGFVYYKIKMCSMQKKLYKRRAGMPGGALRDGSFLQIFTPLSLLTWALLPSQNKTRGHWLISVLISDYPFYISISDHPKFKIIPTWHGHCQKKTDHREKNTRQMTNNNLNTFIRSFKRS
jgi:hypothetical protein